MTVRLPIAAGHRCGLPLALCGLEPAQRTEPPSGDAHPFRLVGAVA